MLTLFPPSFSRSSTLSRTSSCNSLVILFFTQAPYHFPILDVVLLEVRSILAVLLKTGFWVFLWDLKCFLGTFRSIIICFSRDFNFQERSTFDFWDFIMSVSKQTFCHFIKVLSSDHVSRSASHRLYNVLLILQFCFTGDSQLSRRWESQQNLV